MTFTVAIVGRPNVGKSTLFNRLVGKRLALVDDLPGVTRDRREGQGRLGHLEFRLIDTAGFDEAPDGSLEARMRAQTEAAIAEADVCLLLVDARAGVTPMDEHFARLLRASGKPVILVANKSEGRAGEPGVYEAFGLGLGEPVAISAEHGEGMEDLHDALAPYVEAAETEAEPAAQEAGGPLKVAIIGRPNTGKSTLINRLIGEERMLTGPEAGITRDAIAIRWQWQDRSVELWDTAGVRRRARVTDRLEKLSVADTLRAVRFAEVVVVLLDATQPFEKQDLQLVDLVAREGRALVLALNKWDLVADKRARAAELEEAAERLLPQVRGVEMVRLSALRGHGIDRLMPAVVRAHETWNRRIGTGRLNRWLEDMIARHPPPAVKGRRVRIRYITQTTARPPTFVAFSPRADVLPEAYVRYLVNGLREAFDLWGTPIRLHLRKGENPYAD